MPCTEQLDLLPYTTSVALAVVTESVNMVMQWGKKGGAAEAQIAELSAKVEASERRAADAEVRIAAMEDENTKLRADLFSKEDTLAGVRCTYVDFDPQLLSHTCSELSLDGFR